MNEAIFEESLIDLKSISLDLLAGSIALSYLILYNQKLVLHNKEPFWDEQTVGQVVIFLRSLIVIAFAISAYIDFQAYQYVKENNANEGEISSAQQQLAADSLSEIAAIIALLSLLGPSGISNFLAVVGPDI